MSELQTEETGADLNQGTAEVDAGTVESGADLAAASGGDHEQSTDDNFNKEAANKAINKKHWEAREAERKADAATKRADDAEARLQKLEQGDEPVIPPIVDQYDEDYEAKVKARDEAIQRKAQFDFQQKNVADQATRTQNEQVQAQQAKVDGLVTEYNDRSTKLGLDAKKVDDAGMRVVDYGISAELAQFILADEEGPLITTYLADNPLELDRLGKLSPMQAAVRVNSVIREKAASLKPKVTQAPEPAEVLNGRGAPEGKEPWLQGVKYS